MKLVISILGFSIVFFSLVHAECTLLPGFENFNKSTYKGELAPARDPITGLKFITPENTKAILTSDEKDKHIFIDTRPATFYKQCQINGAVNHPYATNGDKTNELTKEIVKQYIDQGKTIVFYCNSFQCYRSINAAIESVCAWGLPATQIKWLGEGVPGLAKFYKRGVKGTNCEQFF